MTFLIALRQEVLKKHLPALKRSKILLIYERKAYSLDTEYHEFSLKAYFPSDKIIETVGSYKMKVVFKHIHISVIITNGKLLQYDPLPD